MSGSVAPDFLLLGLLIVNLAAIFFLLPETKGTDLPESFTAVSPPVAGILSNQTGSTKPSSEASLGRNGHVPSVASDDLNRYDVDEPIDEDTPQDEYILVGGRVTV